MAPQTMSDRLRKNGGNQTTHPLLYTEVTRDVKFTATPTAAKSKRQSIISNACTDKFSVQLSIDSARR